MTRTFVVLAGLTLATAGPARGQWCGPIGVGFGGGYSYSSTVVYGPGFGFGFGYCRAWFYNPFLPVLVGPPPYLGWTGVGNPWFFPPPAPVVVVQPSPRAFAEAFAGRWDRDDPAAFPGRNPVAPSADRVRRGDFVVVRPRVENPGFGRDADAPPLPPLGPPELPKDAKQRAVVRVTLGRAAFAAERYGRAAELLADAARDTPRDPLPFFLLAQARTARGEYAEAAAAVREGVRLAPDWPASGFRVKELYAGRDDRLADHLADLRAAAAAHPADPAVPLLLGYHLWFLGEKAEAAKQFRKAARGAKERDAAERFLQEAEGGKA